MEAPVNRPGDTQGNLNPIPNIKPEERQDRDTTDKTNKKSDEILAEAQKLLKMQESDLNKLAKDLKVLENDLQNQKNHIKDIDNLLSPTLSPEEQAELESELNAALENTDKELDELEKELNDELAKSAEAKRAKNEAETEKIIEDFVVIDKTPDDTKIRPAPSRGVWGIFKKFFG